MVLSVSFLIAVISPPSYFVYSLQVVVSMRQRCLPCWQTLFLPLFLKHSLWTSSQGCNTLCIVISFLFLWSIYLSSSLVHLRKGPEYLTSGTAEVFIPLIKFRPENFVSSSFLVLLRYYFWILSFISTCLMVSASKMPKYLYVLFSANVQVCFQFLLIFLWIFTQNLGQGKLVVTCILYFYPFSWLLHFQSH